VEEDGPTAQERLEVAFDPAGVKGAELTEELTLAASPLEERPAGSGIQDLGRGHGRRLNNPASEAEDDLTMTIEELQKGHEDALDGVMAGRAGKGKESDFALARALVHKAIHLVADRKAGEFCAVATFLAEMIGHAHGLLHPGDGAAPTHSAFKH
jgi:hypothetical protein